MAQDEYSEAHAELVELYRAVVTRTRW